MKTYLKDLKPEEVIRRLKAGEVLKDEHINSQIKYIDDVLCYFCENGVVEYNANVWSCNINYYFETPDELKLEVGKCYKTRDRRKAFISSYEGIYIGIVVGEDTLTKWFANGKYQNNEEHPLDLISEWSDDDVAED